MSAEEKEMLRRAVLECLAMRHPAALMVGGVRRRVEREVDFAISDADVAGALVIIEGLGLAKCEREPLGGTIYWQATSQGVLAVERKG